MGAGEGLGAREPRGAESPRSQMCKEPWTPSDQDILHARIRTTGIVEHTFKIDDNEFRMVDVGGQRNARRKWVHCFEGVTSVIFVASLSGYNQLLVEDNKTNRLHEALNLFGDICSLEWFQRTSIILFLNKKDLFKDMIKKTPLTVCFPEYAGPNDYRSCCNHIKKAFKARNRVAVKKIYTHFTCATDTNNIQKVFTYVKSIILRSHLIEIGLLDASNTNGLVSAGSDDEKDELED